MGRPIRSHPSTQSVGGYKINTHLQDKQTTQPEDRRLEDHPNSPTPEGHHEVEPEEDYQKVKVVHGIPKEEGRAQGPWHKPS